MTTTRSTIRIGTRGSFLARTQAIMIRDQVQRWLDPAVVELTIIRTRGDQITSGALSSIGGKGLFVKEIEDALLSGQVDMAVHSAKDMPVDCPSGLVIAATPVREDPRDAWIGWNGTSLAELPAGAVVGTSSQRRRAQLLQLRKDVTTCEFRGNIDTRLRKVEAGEVAGTFLAMAGLKRACLLPATAEALAMETFIPAAGQGVLALQCRSDDAMMRAALGHLHDVTTGAAWEFERAIVKALGANCQSPIGVCAVPRGVVNGVRQPGWIVRGIVALPDGSSEARATLMTQTDGAQALQALQQPLLKALNSRGAQAIMKQLRSEP